MKPDFAPSQRVAVILAYDDDNPSEIGFGFIRLRAGGHRRRAVQGARIGPPGRLLEVAEPQIRPLGSLFA